MTTRIAPGVGANLLGQHAAERNQDATAYVGNLDPQTMEELLWELFVQAGPVVNVYVPKDRVTNLHQGYGFVEFRNEDDADYAIKVLNMIKLYGKAIKVNKATQDKKSLDVGANLFIGNLDPDVDEKLLHDTFSAFGFIVTNPKIMRESDTGNSRNFGFVSYDSFEASDAAIEAMHGQYLCNRQITVTYAYKKDTRELHGTPAERVLAASNPGTKKSRPHTLFASGPPSLANASQVANGTSGAPVLPPQVSLAHIPATLPPRQVFPPMQMSGPQSWQGHQPQPGQLLAQPGVQPPPLPQHFRQPPPNVHPPLPPPHMAQMLNRPPPPPAGGMGAPYWRQPPPPQHMMGGNHPMQQMSMPLPPPPPTALPPPPPAMS